MDDLSFSSRFQPIAIPQSEAARLLGVDVRSLRSPRKRSLNRNRAGEPVFSSSALDCLIHQTRARHLGSKA
jgi:hypothetical protein